MRLCTGCPQVEPDADREKEELHSQGGGNRAPKSKTDPPIPAGIERQVGAMGERVEKPMTQHRQPAHPRSPSIPTSDVVHRPQDESPAHDRQKAMRYRIVEEGERRYRGGAPPGRHPPP